jgi:hypothetical protein
MAFGFHRGADHKSQPQPEQQPKPAVTSGWDCDEDERPIKRTLSDFIRNATVAEKERVYAEVMKKAGILQADVIKTDEMRLP